MKTVSVAEARSISRPSWTRYRRVAGLGGSAGARGGATGSSAAKPTPPADAGLVQSVDSCDGRTDESDRHPSPAGSTLLMYIDTSLLVSYYCPETLSRAAERVLRGDPHPAISDLVEVEFFSALAGKVRARQMPAADARRAGDEFLGHLQAACTSASPSSGGTTRPPAAGWRGSRCPSAPWMLSISLSPTRRDCAWRPPIWICRDRPGV